MQSTRERSLNICFTTIKLPSTTNKRPPTTTTTTTESPSSFPPEDLNRPFPNPTTTSASSINLVKNFNLPTTSRSIPPPFQIPLHLLLGPDTAVTSDLLAAAFFSHRFFFFSSPGRSKSIVSPSSSSSSPSSSSSHDRSDKMTVGGVAIPTYSHDPIVDFRQSIVDMVEARQRLVGITTNHLRELLTCYLSLNPKSAHKFIVHAFSEVLVSAVAARRQRTVGGDLPEEMEQVQKIQILTLNIGVVYSSMGPDARVLVRKSRKQAEQYHRLYKEPIPVTQLVRETAAIMQEFTQSG